MKNVYDMENLKKTFEEHAIKSENLNKECIEKFHENNPGEPLPDLYKEDFSFPLALSAICEEILNLKKTIKLLKDKK